MNEKTFFGKRMQYWTAKEIMELFEFHEDQIDERNDSAREANLSERWSISRRDVTFEISERFSHTTHKIVVETHIFNEFEEDSKKKYKVITDLLDDKYVRTIADYSKVIEDYFTYFNESYDCQFGVFDRR